MSLKSGQKKRLRNILDVWAIPYISYKHILKFHYEILKLIGLDDFSIKSVSKGLCEASLRGVDSHGIRLLPHYVDSALMGRKNPKPNFIFKKKFPSIGILDADNAFGHAAGMKAVKYGIEIANEMGMAAVAVKNSSHPGALASISLIAAKKGLPSGVIKIDMGQPPRPVMDCRAVI